MTDTRTDDEAPGESMDGPDESRPEVKTIRQADLVISPLLMAASLWFAYDSFRMSKKAIDAGQATIATSPGLFPLITSVLIFGCSGYVLAHAIGTRPSLDFLAPARLRARCARFDAWTAIIVLGLFALYVFGLLGRMPFELATVIYIVAMMAIFRATRLWIAVVVAVGYTLAVSYTFTEWAATLLPRSIFN